MAKQEVVEPLPGGFGVDGQEVDGGVRRAGVDARGSIRGIWSPRGAFLRTYNVFHQRGRVSA
ncbi:hypothetical protein D9M68_744440 [compost metagenome]